jgi:hypothetical protein
MVSPHPVDATLLPGGSGADVVAEGLVGALVTMGVAVGAHPVRRRDTPTSTRGGQRRIPQVSHRCTPPIYARRSETLASRDNTAPISWGRSTKASWAEPVESGSGRSRQYSQTCPESIVASYSQGGVAISNWWPGGGVPPRGTVNSMLGPEGATRGSEITGVDVGGVTGGGML